MVHSMIIILFSFILFTKENLIYLIYFCITMGIMVGNNVGLNRTPWRIIIIKSEIFLLLMFSQTIVMLINIFVLNRHFDEILT